MWHVWGRREMHTGFWWCNLKEWGHLKDIIIAGEKILQWIDLAENSGGCCENGNEPWSSIK
jgi:hypothetical protein